MADKTDEELIGLVNANALRACGGFGMAYVAWKGFAGPEWAIFGYVAACCAVGGAIRTVKAVFNMIRFIPRIGKRARFKSKGVDPKADAMAQSSDLKKRGLMK
ncbi:hypothetical protein [uncultured Tateyamaria sp.]|uniref:hypothetical protein n=1 Tax=uncultured Tateyamaria sp. TaxID=455651 RepID=UPI00262DF9A5|nr:hypothetical protein [uncultured Tateyamaria sp.]